MVERIILANPRGFCAGVSRAIDIVELALQKFGKPIYVRHPIVHNIHVVRELEKKGAVFVESLDAVPTGSYVIFSAHGSPAALRQEAVLKGLKPIDAVCPLVTKVHVEARRFARNGFEIVYIGHRGHQEAIGVTSIAPMHLVETLEDVENLVLASDKAVILTQTTLSVDDARKLVEALKKKYPFITETPKEDICYATTNRQGAVKELAKQADVILVIGSPTSSNSVRLVETATAMGKPAYLINDKTELQEGWITNAKIVGVTSGASGPEDLVLELVEFLKEKFNVTKVENLVHTTENVEFVLPDELKEK
ncbi:MAG: 4-hydroxy-3-methylbut-2-enyl diphosphate reductase [Nanoarchaeota archaeon]|nr:4-hydroxy-3-methylbut-2-enyl diphosphate reductase [Nanoarchaeota archaeon]